MQKDPNSWFSTQRTWCWEKVSVSGLIKQATGPPGQDYALRNRLNKLRDGQVSTNNKKNNISPLYHYQHYHVFLVLYRLYLPHHLFSHHSLFLIHFNSHCHDLIIFLVPVTFLHDFHLQILIAETKYYLELYSVCRHKHLLEKKKKKNLFRTVFWKTTPFIGQHHIWITRSTKTWTRWWFVKFIRCWGWWYFRTKIW